MISMGAGSVLSIVGRESGMWGVGRLLFEMVVGVWVRVVYVVVLCEGMCVVVMYLCHEVCMVVSFGITSFGNLRCSVLEGRSRVARRVSMEVRRAALAPGLSPLGSLAITTVVGCICSV